ncbi:Testicular haploid expressed gene protein-like [Acropora cervicornis]|uniref:Testicular haploid expressed gene protein-like n=1 Tax=Acropora cervicornis TaxID=6130 RepID=A0AAD9QCJ5_ACRCE|nr:Testicular haploid expressed gene protein-like [Acropora cervicornis]
MAAAKPHSLTSKNLKRFEKQFQEERKKSRRSLQRKIYPERTEADGQSSGIQSYGSQLSVFKDNLNEQKEAEKNAKGNILHGKRLSLLDRPRPETFRGNPEGQSRNESRRLTPRVVKIHYAEKSDHNSYNSQESDLDGQEKDTDDDDEDADDDDDSEEESSESDEISEDDDDEDSDDDDDESDSQAIPPWLRETPVSVRTHYTSSLNASSSSIPTIASQAKSPESIKTKTEREGSVASKVSSAPSYVMNKNQYRMKKLAVKKEKERGKLETQDTESEISFGLSHNLAAASRVSTRERGSTSQQSKGSYVTVRNWSRWTNYSGAGYSISEGSEVNKRSRKRKKNAFSTRAQTPRTRPVSRTLTQHDTSKSQPNLRKTGKQNITVTVDPDILRARRVSRTQIASRLSIRSIIKSVSVARAKSLPDLNREAVKSYFMMERDPTITSGRFGHERQNKSRDSTKRRKRILKRKERPKRNETSLSSASTVHSKATPVSLKGDRGSLLSSAISASSISKETGRSSHTSSVSSKLIVASKKPSLKPLRTNTGYLSKREFSSGQGSLLAPSTPISLILKRTPSQRSIVSEYSSYLSFAASSIKSARIRSRSRSSLSSTDGESTAVGPKPTSADKKNETPQNRSSEKENKFAIERERSTVKPQSSKIDKREEHREETRTSSSKSKRSPSLKQEKESDSETENLQLPPISPPANETSSVENSRNNSSLMVASPEVIRVNHPLPDLTEATRDTGMPLTWGNQEPMRPIPRAALSANTQSGRLITLATPKKDFQHDHPIKCNREQYTYSCGRESMILGVHPFALKANISDRVAQLARPKPEPEGHTEQRAAYIFSCGRSSPIWSVREAAKTAEEREYTLRLSLPKKAHPQYQPEREVPWPVSKTARRAVSSTRVEQLSRPKTREDGPVRESAWRVSSASRRAVASARVQALAKPKQTVEGYLPCKEVEWAINRGTLRVTASERTQTLAKPIIRESMDHLQFNPDAFAVSESARKANPSQRIVELAQPLLRGHK